MLQPLATSLQVALLLLTAIAACFDVPTRRVPNWLSLAGCLAGLTMNGAMTGLHGLRTAAFGLGLGFALYFPLWLLGARGAGDVKLLAAAGSLIGAPNTFVLFLLAAVMGGVLALGLILVQGATRQTLVNVLKILGSLVMLRKPERTLATSGALRLPHALVIFLAAVAQVAILRR